jgi:hypothetical protein
MVTIANLLLTAKMNDVETLLGLLSYLVAFKTFLRVRPGSKNEVPGCGLGAVSGWDWRHSARQGLARSHWR